MSEPQRQHVGPADAPSRYELLERKAAGGEGEVWKAREFHGGQPFLYAVKIIHGQPGQPAERQLEELRGQAGIATHLEHPSLVKVKEVFVGAAPDGGQRLYFVMKWIEGGSMQDALERGALRAGDVLGWLEPIADALDHLHSGRDTNGIAVLHRDIKPANIVRSDDGRIYLVDFGLLRLRTTDATGRISGTAPFMAPESIHRGEFSPASDRFALGATVYFALTGEPPAGDDQEVRAGRLAAALGRPADDRMVRGILTMLDPLPDRRPAKAADWIRALRSAPMETSQALPGPGPLSPTSSGPAAPAYRPMPGPIPGPSRPPFPPPGYPGPPRQFPTAGYPMPPSMPPPPHLGPAAAGYLGRPAQPLPKSHAGKITALVLAVVGLVVAAVCCVPLYSLIRQTNDNTGNGDTEQPSTSRTVDRSVAAPIITSLEPILVSVADITAVMQTKASYVQASEDLDLIGGGLNRFALCAERGVAGDAIGAYKANGLYVNIDGYPRVASAVAGFYGTYAAEFFTAVRAHTERCGWQQFTVPNLGEESFGVSLTDTSGYTRAMLFVRSGQAVFVVAVRTSSGRSSQQSDAIQLATKMSARMPK